MLNKQQVEAVEHTHGPCFVSACPGSGKTSVIVTRAVRLIEKGFAPKSILCITFTNKAAKEMKERVHKKVGDQANEIYISTFHALCATILRKYGKYLGYDARCTIVDDDEQQALMMQVARQNGHELKKNDVQAILYKLNDLRENCVDENEYATHFAKQYETSIATEYMRSLRKKNQVDFSGLLSETIRLLTLDDSVRSLLQQRFDFIMVDETQDTNFAQFKIVDLIGAHNNVFIVGDSDQGIYSWRGARYQNIVDFVNDRKAKVIELYENYRSTPEIISAASKLVKKNSNRLQKIEFKTSNLSGPPVELYSVRSTSAEGQFIANKIDELVNKHGYQPRDIAVLYRLNSMSRMIEQGLTSRNIPYEVVGGLSFYDRTEIKDAIAMLRFLLNPQDSLALHRFINKPTSKIGEVTLGAIENYANSNNISALDAMRDIDKIDVDKNAKNIIAKRCKNIVDAFDFDIDSCKLPLSEILATILDKIEYYDFLRQKYDDNEYEDRKLNLNELLRGIAIYTSVNANDLGSYLASISLQSSADKVVDENHVTLMTLHASKGLEFPVVIMPCMEDGQMPHERAVRAGSLEEERRLCYVGMTRAKRTLVLTYSLMREKRSRGGIYYEKTKPSQFISEAGLSNFVKRVT